MCLHKRYKCLKATMIFVLELCHRYSFCNHAVASSRQINSQSLQASAHSLQAALWEACLEHSSKHALQTSAHKACRCAPNCEPLASNRAHRAHISAQSRHNKIHFLLSAATQAVIQLSQLIKHAMQASIHFFEISIALFLNSVNLISRVTVI